MTTSSLLLSRAASERRWAAPLALVALPFAPVLAAPWVGYDVSTVRGAVVLAEVACVLVLTTPARLVEGWRAVPGWARWAVAVWGGWMVVTTVLAAHPGPAALRTAEWIAHLAFLGAVWDAARGSDRRAEDVLRWSGGAALWLCVGAAAWWCVSAWTGGEPSGRSTPLAGVRNVGIYALSGLALWLGAVGRDRPSAYWCALWSSGWAVLGWNGGRASLGAGLVLIAAWWLLSRPRARLAIAVGGAALGGLAASLVLPHDAHMGLSRLLSRATAVGERYGSGRTELWAHVLSAWGERPWVGLGGDGPAFALADHTYSHNVAVQALGEWGIVGAGAFGALLVGTALGLVRVAWRLRRPARAAAAAGLLAALGNGLLDGVFYGALSLALLAVLVGVGLGARSTPRPGRPGAPAPWGARAVAAALALIAGVAGLHLAASGARYAAGSPAPGSAQARVALATTTSYRQTEVLWWAKDWAREHPEASLRAARWGQRHTRTPWAFLALEGDLHAAAGDSARAAELWRRAGESLAGSYPARVAASRAPERAAGAAPRAGDEP